MIVSTTISGNSEAIIGDALKSVIPYVDLCLVVDTGITDNTLKVARETCGDKLRVLFIDWKNDFAYARNAALEWAESLGADWALTIDTDERLVINETRCSTLEFATSDVILVFDEYRAYAKDRYIRLPRNSADKWVGRVHEAYVTHPGCRKKIAHEVAIKEIPKTPEQLKAKFERDLVILTEMVKETPDDARWWFYLGETEKWLGMRGAYDSFENCATLTGWDEEEAWANYRLAELHAIDGMYAGAINQCTVALSAHPGFAEAAWLAGWCSYQLGNYRNAVYWARIAKTIVYTEKELPRIGFRHLPAYCDGPADVERHAWVKLLEQK